jgi:hypothetical protein
MIGLAAGTQIWIVAGVTDMRRGFTGLSGMVQTALYEGRFDAAFAWRDHKRVKVDQDAEKGYGKKHEYDARIVLHQVSDVWAKPLPRR